MTSPPLPKLTSEDLEALLLLSRTPGLTMRGLGPFFERGLAPSEVLERIRAGENLRWKESLAATRKIFDPEREIERAAERGIDLVSFGDERYPALLKETSDPPFLLYAKGNLLECDQVSISIVGTRHPSLYGREQAKRFSQRLAEWGFTIVSGFARGIDREAHEGALSVRNGRTIAVLGSGLDVIYPKEHQALHEEIAERGALVSEFALGTPPLAENFPKRNRIIAGLSLGVLVMEAHSRSGSLITAHLAAEEGREVFALPGRVDQLGSRGTHRLIKEGAALVESPEEILEALAPQLWALVPPEAADPLDEEEKNFLSLFISRSLTRDEAQRESHLPPPFVTRLLTQLEVKHALRRRLDGRYEPARAKSWKI